MSRVPRLENPALEESKSNLIVSSVNDLDGLGLALLRVGFIDLCLGLEPSIHTERKSGLLGFA